MVHEIIQMMSDAERREFEAVSEALSTGEFWYDTDTNDLWNDHYVSNFDYETGSTKVCVSVKGMYLKTTYAHCVYASGNNENEMEVRPYGDDDVDYAAVEETVYQNAVIDGVEKFFAETEGLGNGVYAQRKVHNIFTIPVDYPSNSDEHHKALDLINKYGLNKIPEGFILAALEDGSTIEELQTLACFLNKFDINDLHDGNMGWIDGHPVFFDYCGYCSSISQRVM